MGFGFVSMASEKTSMICASEDKRKGEEPCQGCVRQGTIQKGWLPDLALLIERKGGCQPQKEVFSQRVGQKESPRAEYWVERPGGLDQEGTS